MDLSDLRDTPCSFPRVAGARTTAADGPATADFRVDRAGERPRPTRRLIAGPRLEFSMIRPRGRSDRSPASSTTTL